MSLRQVNFTVDKELLTEFTELLKRCQLRRDEWLGMVIENELKELEKLEPNGKLATQHLKKFYNLSTDGQGMQLKLRIRSETADRLKTACKEKGIPRNAFIDSLLRFLCEGDEEGWVSSPLGKIAQLVEDPRLEWNYATKPFQELSISERRAKEMEALTRKTLEELLDLSKRPGGTGDGPLL